jgi:hypothetical protein
MANDFGDLDKMTVVSQLIVDALQKKLIPINFALDATQDVANFGDAVTVHLYENENPNAVETLNGDEDSDTGTTDVNLTPVTVTLNKRASDGFDLSELVLQRSPAKDLVTKFAGKKIHQLAKGVLLDVYTQITSGNFAAEVDASGGYDWEFHAETILKKCYDMDLDPAAVQVVLSNKCYSELVASIPTLAGIDKTSVLESGVIESVGGTKIVRSPLTPVQAPNGFVATRDALAAAWRPLPALNNNISYGESLVAQSENGIALRVRRYQNPETGLIAVRMDSIYGRSAFNGDALFRLM